MTQFAELAGVNRSTVSRVAKTSLAAAMVGSLVDANHEAAREYLAKRSVVVSAEAPATGLDPLYESAVAACQTTGYYSIGHIQRSQKIGYNRAFRIHATMQAAGLIPAGGGPKTPTQAAKDYAPTPAPPATPPRGGSVVAAAKKSAPPIQQEPDEVPDDISAFADMTLRELIRRFGTDVRFVDWLKAVKAIEDIHEKRLKNAATQGTLIARRVVEEGLIDTINTTHKKLLTDGAKSIAARVKSAAQLGETDTQLEDIVVEQISSFIQPCKAKMGRLMRNV